MKQCDRRTLVRQELPLATYRSRAFNFVETPSWQAYVNASSRAGHEFPYYHLRVEFDRCGRMGDSYGEQVKSTK